MLPPSRTFVPFAQMRCVDSPRGWYYTPRDSPQGSAAEGTEAMEELATQEILKDNSRSAKE